MVDRGSISLKVILFSCTIRNSRYVRSLHSPSETGVESLWLDLKLTQREGEECVGREIEGSKQPRLGKGRNGGRPWHSICHDVIKGAPACPAPRAATFHQPSMLNIQQQFCERLNILLQPLNRLSKDLRRCLE